MVISAIPSRLVNWADGVEIGKRGNDNVYLKCPCGNNCLNVFYYGEIKEGFFAPSGILGKTYEGYSVILLQVCCPDCGEVIDVFCNLTDGYDGALGLTGYFAEVPDTPMPQIKEIALEKFLCSKCGHQNFNVRLELEHTVEESELADFQGEGFTGTLADLYTGITISLQCCKCQKKYMDFLGAETA